jgi:hypothetical protein
MSFDIVKIKSLKKNLVFSVKNPFTPNQTSSHIVICWARYQKLTLMFHMKTIISSYFYLLFVFSTSKSGATLLTGSFNFHSKTYLRHKEIKCEYTIFEHPLLAHFL